MRNLKRHHVPVKICIRKRILIEQNFTKLDNNILYFSFSDRSLLRIEIKHTIFSLKFQKYSIHNLENKRSTFLKKIEKQKKDKFAHGQFGLITA